MMYTRQNFKTKKALKKALEAGERLELVQLGPFGGKPINGTVFLEGPHFPAAHTWYAQGYAEDGLLVELDK